MNAPPVCASGPIALWLPPDPLSLESSAQLLEEWKPAQRTSQKIALQAATTPRATRKEPPQREPGTGEKPKEGENRA